MTEKAEIYRDRKINEIMGNVENKVRHAYNCGYEQGFADGKIAYAEMLTKLVGEKMDALESEEQA